MVKLLDVNKDWLQARPELIKVDTGWVFTGYQSYTFTGDKIVPEDRTLQAKDAMVRPYLEGLISADSTILDLGCSNLYFGLLAQILGAKSILGVDIDKRYLAKLHMLIYAAKLPNVRIIDRNVADVSGEYDIVIALAIIHWIYSCTALIGSLNEAVKFLGRLTKKALFIEWVDKDDPVVQKFGHVRYNEELTKRDYNKEIFLSTLDEIFKEVKSIGVVKLGREVFLCTK